MTPAAAVLRHGLIAASRNAALTSAAKRYGRRLGARRFVAGETLDDFTALATRLEREGFLTAGAVLGEGVRNPDDARRVVAAHRALFERIASSGLRSTVSLKLTNLGLDIGEELARSNLAELLADAARHGIFVRIDMEESRYVDATLRTYRAMREAGHENVGTVLQSYLRRTLGDLESLLPLQPNLRLVKGAYLEPESIAFPDKREVDENYLRLIDAALPVIGFSAIATHDEAAIEHALKLAKRRQLVGHFEVQMLYGIRPQLQRQLLARSVPTRLLVSYGSEWFPYFMRRLAERPANLWFVLRSALTP
jgi:proline dehydrogenase